MKKILFLFLLLAAFFANAQTATVTLSKEFNLRDRGLPSNNGTTFKLGDFYYSAEYDYKNSENEYTAKLAKIKYGINLYKYNADMKEIKKVSLNGGKREYGPYAPYTVTLNNKLLFFHYRIEGESIKFSLTTVDPETLTEVGTQELYTITESDPDFLNSKTDLYTRTLRLTKSADQTRLFVHQGNANGIFTCVVNSNIEVSNPSVFAIKNHNDFLIQDVIFDNVGNEYASYIYTLNNVSKRGLLINTIAGKHTYVDYDMEQTGAEATKFGLFLSNDDNKLYVYNNYDDSNGGGIVESSIDANTLSFSKPIIFPYTDDVKDKLHKMGFASKSKNGSYGLNHVHFRCNQLDDGTLVFSGYPTYYRSASVPVSGGVSTYSGNMENGAAGPIVTAFVKGEQCNYGVLLRKEIGTDPSGFITIPYKNALIYIYCDTKKSLELGNEVDAKNVGKGSQLVLAEAVLSNDGTILSKKEIYGAPKGSNHYYLDNYQYLSNNSFIVPIGSNRVNMVRYFNEIVQWAQLDIE